MPIKYFATMEGRKMRLWIDRGTYNNPRLITTLHVEQKQLDIFGPKEYPRGPNVERRIKLEEEDTA